MKQNKSAKEIAFEKERTKFRSEIRSMEYQIRCKDKKIEELEETVRQREEEVLKLNDWVERLLEYTEISKTDLQMIIESEKEKLEVLKGVETFFGKWMRSG